MFFQQQENVDNIMELSLNFELDIADVTQTIVSAANKTRCGPFCQLKIILKIVDILRESFTIVLPHPGYSVYTSPKHVSFTIY